ncbi:MAG: hypothetical protein ABW098_20495, partial [Candidatus Thiodiazotropha sp.]
HEDKCKSHPVCSKCGEPATHHESQCKNPVKCVNCGEGHDANSKECKIWHKEKEILRVKFTRNISFPEARKIVESPPPVPGSSYASIIKPTVKPVTLTDATTQTDPVTILDSEGVNGEQTSEPNNKQQSSTTQTKQVTVTENTNTASAPSQGKQTSKEEPVLKNATLEMMRKDWQKQQRRERQLNNKPPSPKANKDKKKQVMSDRLQKGSKDELQLQNRYETLSDESEMEFVDTLDHSQSSDKASWSPILPPSP